MQTMTFRSSKIVYYGPFECPQCGVPVCKMGAKFGGNGFTYPEGPIYPNSEWHPHVCDQRLIRKLDAEGAKKWVESRNPSAKVNRDGMGFTIRDTIGTPISCYATDENGAWLDAFESMFRGSEIVPPSVRSSPTPIDTNHPIP